MIEIFFLFFLMQFKEMDISNHLTRNGYFKSSYPFENKNYHFFHFLLYDRKQGNRRDI